MWRLRLRLKLRLRLLRRGEVNVCVQYCFFLIIIHRAFI